MSYILHFLVPWTPNCHLRPRPHNFDLTTKNRPITEFVDVPLRNCSLTHSLTHSLNVILLPGCFQNTFIDMMLVTLLFYVFPFLFFYMYRLYLPLFYHIVIKL